MKQFLARLALFLCFLGIGPRTFGQSPDALVFFKDLKGTWSIQSGEKKLSAKVVYDLASRDSIVTEYFGKELSVFHLDGEELLMTHFCNRGSHPRLKLKQGGATGVVEFEMLDITNLKDPASGSHVQRVRYQLLQPNQLNLEIIWRKGNTEETEKYLLTKDP